MSKLLNILRQDTSIESAFSFGEYHHITFHNEGPEAETQLINRLVTSGITSLESKPIIATIEDCFIRLMQSNALAPLQLV